MDPKEYAARLQRMRDEMETAKALEKISAGYNKAMETSPATDTVERLYAEFKQAKPEKPKAKAKAKPAAVNPKSAPAPAPPAHDDSEMSRRSPRNQIGVPQEVLERDDLERRFGSANRSQRVAATPTPQAQGLDQATVDMIMSMPESKVMSTFYDIRGQIDPRLGADPKLMHAYKLLEQRKREIESRGANPVDALRSQTPYVPALLGGRK